MSIIKADITHDRYRDVYGIVNLIAADDREGVERLWEPYENDPEALEEFSAACIEMLFHMFSGFARGKGKDVNELLEPIILNMAERGQSGT